MAARRIYRAEAFYDDPRYDTSRHFLTRRARDAWARRRLAGYPVSLGLDPWSGGHRGAIPAATRVVISDSGLVAWERTEEWT